MSKLGAAFLCVSLLVAPLAAGSAAAAEASSRHIAQGAAWGCRDKGDLIDLLFQGLSASFSSKLESAVADGRCAYFKSGDTVTILEDSGHGIVRVQVRGASPAAYWTPLRNVE